MEFILACLIEIEKAKLGGQRFEPYRFTSSRSRRVADQLNWLIMSLGTDGKDGSTDAAGAWIEPGVFDSIQKLCLSPEKALANNDSYNFFKKTGHLIYTGSTQTNVMDLRLFLLGFGEDTATSPP